MNKDEAAALVAFETTDDAIRDAGWNVAGSVYEEQRRQARRVLTNADADEAGAALNEQRTRMRDEVIAREADETARVYLTHMIFNERSERRER